MLINVNSFTHVATENHSPEVAVEEKSCRPLAVRVESDKVSSKDTERIGNIPSLLSYVQ